MAVAPLGLAAPRVTVAGGDVAAVERWAESERSHLAHLYEELQQAEAEARAAEDDLTAEHTDVDASGSLEDFNELVDAMVRGAQAALGARVDAVRQEAALLVAAAVEDADDPASPPSEVEVAAVGTETASAVAPTATHPTTEPQRLPETMIHAPSDPCAPETTMAPSPSTANHDIGGTERPRGADEVFWRNLPETRVRDLVRRVSVWGRR